MIAFVVVPIAWIGCGVLATHRGVRRGLIPPGVESLGFYVHGAAIGPFAWLAVK